MKRIVIGSLSPVKSRATERAFRKLFPDELFNLQSVDVSSGVSNQPLSDVETRQGATNRAEAARLADPSADFWVGIEGGIEDGDVGMAAFAWVVIHSPAASGKGRTATFFLPEQLATYVRTGMELGNASDIVLGCKRSKESGGAIGVLTNNAVDRTALYEQGIIMALLPFGNEALYRQPV